MEPLTFMIGKTVSGKIYFRLLDDADRILMTSRYYSHVQYCLSDIYFVQRYNDDINWNVEADEGFKRLHYTMARDGRVIARSPDYELPRYLTKDLQKVKDGVCSAALVDLSSVVRFFRPIRV